MSLRHACEKGTSAVRRRREIIIIKKKKSVREGTRAACTTVYDALLLPVRVDFVSDGAGKVAGIK